ncbi:MAG: GNAT family N-acetyltransferase [Candidatus Korobacteraceae bacterium]
MSSLVAAPTLETPRLRLRGHGLDDFPHSAAMWADPVVVRYIRPTPFNEEETWARLLRYVGHWALLGYGFWVVEDKQTGEFLGEAGFLNFHRDTDPPRVINIPEAGWAFRADAHGRGYASETMAALVAWGDTRFDTPTACIIEEKNGASIRVAEKNGYRPRQVITYRGEEVMMYVRERTAS